MGIWLPRRSPFGSQPPAELAEPNRAHPLFKFIDRLYLCGTEWRHSRITRSGMAETGAWTQIGSSTPRVSYGNSGALLTRFPRTIKYGLQVSPGSNGAWYRNVNSVSAAPGLFMFAVFVANGSTGFYEGACALGNSAGPLFMLGTVGDQYVVARVRTVNGGTLADYGSTEIPGRGYEVAALFHFRDTSVSGSLMCLNGMSVVGGMTSQAGTPSVYYQEAVSGVVRGTNGLYLGDHMVGMWGYGRTPASMDISAVATEWSRNPWSLWIER